eukprot:scaffold149768_cov34-Prasinocladus_malaysianus.AAC.2
MNTTEWAVQPNGLFRPPTIEPTVRVRGVAPSCFCAAYDTVRTPVNCTVDESELCTQRQEKTSRCKADQHELNQLDIAK